MQSEWDADINPHTFGPLVFDKEFRNMQRKKAATSTNVGGQTGSLHVEECKLISTSQPSKKPSPSDSKTST